MNDKKEKSQVQILFFAMGLCDWLIIKQFETLETSPTKKYSLQT
jgi:hypothetical protein